MKLLGVADNTKVKRSEQNGMTLGDTQGVTTNLIFCYLLVLHLGMWYIHCKKIRRFYGKIPGIWLPVLTGVYL